MKIYTSTKIEEMDAGVNLVSRPKPPLVSQIYREMKIYTSTKIEEMRTYLSQHQQWEEKDVVSKPSVYD